jgi:hypothetical protein
VVEISACNVSLKDKSKMLDTLTVNYNNYRSEMDEKYKSELVKGNVCRTENEQLVSLKTQLEKEMKENKELCTIKEETANNQLKEAKKVQQELRDANIETVSAFTNIIHSQKQ